jgi:catechol 2,3-dioxygenase
MAELTPGPVRLTVADPDTQRDFYETAVGLEPLKSENGVVRLGAGGLPLVELEPAPQAPPRPPRTTGLFHLAIVVPTRADLARALHRVLAAKWRLTGAADHLVSEALYLDDPEGNGIEIYRDRPREEWRYDDGQLQMATLPLDLEGVLSELGPGDHEAGKMPEGTRMGHVHLQVDDLGPAREFYEGELGLDVTVESYPGALFLSSGGYHHHIGLNVWGSQGSPPAPPGSRGLRGFVLRGADQPAELTDPAGNPVSIRP